MALRITLVVNVTDCPIKTNFIGLPRNCPSVVHSTGESETWIWGKAQIYSFKAFLKSIYCPTMLISKILQL